MTNMADSIIIITMVRSEMPIPYEESTPRDAVRDRIIELTGIEPRTGNVPLEETARLVGAVQAGDMAAAEALIATRLMWMHDKYAQREVIKQRYDLELADILSVGSLATVIAAQRIDSQSPIIGDLFHNLVPRLMDEIIVDGKLVPSVADEGSRIVRSAKLHPDRVIDDIEPVEPDELHALMEEDRTVAAATTEDEAIKHLAEDAMTKALQGLNERERHVIESWLGIDCDRMDLSELASTYHVTKSYIHQIKDRALAKLSNMHQIVELRYFLGHNDAWYEKWQTEKARRRQAWLEEIEAKQERGELAFVRGSLLKQPLPPAVQAYLTKEGYIDHESPDEPRVHQYAAGLRAALKAAGVAIPENLA